MALTQTQVSELYVAIFNRASEGEGNTFWQASADAATAADAMLATADAQAYFGASLDTDQAFIEHIYSNTFNKTYAEDTAGVDFWVAALATESRGAVIAAIVDAATDPANAGDARDQFNNRVAVSDYTADTLAAAPADYATSLAFNGDLTVTNNADDVAAAQAAVDALVPDVVEPTGETFLLTTAQDNLTGTDAADSFVAHIFDNANTAQSGDMVNGGAGTDSLFADIGNSQNFAITLDTNSVENFAVRAQAAASDTNENNLHSVQIDAERMVGTNRYESNNSRDDVIIEDVRIEDEQITKDITVAMVQTDPGTVDFGVYFDQHSLRAAPADTAGAVLNLEIMDTRSADAGLDPLQENPFNGFTFTLGGAAYTVASDEIDDATTYAEFVVAVQNAVNSTVGLEDVTANLSGTFTAIDTLSGNSLTGQVVTLTNSGAGSFVSGNWTTADGTVPGGGGLHREQDTLPPSTTGNLITSTIILDDVGRGSMSGDLVIGGLSTGDTSDSKGVEQFDITVERSSELQEVQSTNNTLEEVYLVNGTTAGNLVIAGNTNGDDDLPGVDADAAGLTDVRIVDASAMLGTVAIDAVLSGAVVGKYMTLTDDATDATADNIDFIYTLGSNDDTLNLDLSAQNLAAAGTTTREDFTLVVNGAGGDDSITTVIGTPAAPAATAANWYLNSTSNANLVVNGDSGNDTIHTLGGGNFAINAGTGNDVVYTDNAGLLTNTATWVVNATNVNTADLISDVVTMAAATDQLLYKSQLTVTYTGDGSAAVAGGVTSGVAAQNVNGFESTVTIGTSDYIGNRTNINQAIKDAINNDAVLSTLLSAVDGPADTLIITSLIDGALAATDLIVNIAAADSTTFSASELLGLDTAWEVLNANSGIAAVAQGDLNTAATNATTLYANTNAVDFASAGTISTFDSDNVINLGNGDDVVVLGTDATSNDVLVFSGTIGNNTVVNFENAASAFQDQLDFTGYLGGMTSATGSVESQVLIATTGDNAGVAATTLAANEVATVNNWTAVVGETWAEMTAADVLLAIQNDAGPTGYGNLVNASFDVATIATLVGNDQKGVIMIENDTNAGEYKVFETTADNTTQEFTAVTLVGTIDFGNSVDASVVGALV